MLSKVKDYWKANREDLLRGILGIGISACFLIMVGFISAAEYL